jgi:hypothetical protein
MTEEAFNPLEQPLHLRIQQMERLIEVGRTLSSVLAS